jgi:Ca2+/H+ antiporter
MDVDELVSAGGTAVILSAIAFFPFRVMWGLWQWGHVIAMVVSIIS